MSSMKIGANLREETEEVKIGLKTPYVDSSGQAYLSVLVLAERRPECENEDEARESSAGQNEQPLDGGDFDDPEDRDGNVDEEGVAVDAEDLEEREIGLSLAPFHECVDDTGHEPPVDQDDHSRGRNYRNRVWGQS